MTERAHETVKPLIGLAYLLILTALVALCVLAYQRAFPWQRTVPVTLTTSQAGLQLNPRSDVKLKGVVVGQVASITSDGQRATVHLALDPAMTPLIPANVDAAIVPKTLFGEKQVNLLPPPGPPGAPIQAGDAIHQSSTAVELGELLTNLDGVLRTLRPAELSLALNSLADALQGRGAELGNTVALLNTYLGGLNPRLPALVHDIRQVAIASGSYADAAPDLLRVLDNASAISSELLLPHERPLADFLRDNITAADRISDLVRRNGDTVITLTGHARPVLEVVAKYAGEFPCLVDTLVLANTSVNHVLGGQGPYLSADIDLVVQRPAYRYPKDVPSNPGSAANNDNLPYGIPNWQPHCAAVPSQLRGLSDVGPYQLAIRGPVASAPGGPKPPASSGAPEDNQRALTNALGGQLLGVPPNKVPGTAQLLLLPLTLNGKVNVP